MPTVRKLALDSIITDAGTQAREKLDQGVVADYADALGNKVEFDPVDVFTDGKSTWLADGFHRYHSHVKAERKQIEARVHKGTLRDAILFSLAANSRHGLRRSNADKRRAVETLLGDAEWAKWSVRRIASHCGVGHVFVADMKRDSVHGEQTNPSKSAAGKASAKSRSEKKVAADVSTDAASNPAETPPVDEVATVAAQAEHAQNEAPRDSLGRRLPDEIAADYRAAAELFATAANLTTQLVGAIGKLPGMGRLKEQVQLAGHEIRSAAPATKCVHCKLLPALREACEHCKGRGWSSVAQWKAAVEPLKIDGSRAMVYSAGNLVRVADLA